MLRFLDAVPETPRPNEPTRVYGPPELSDVRRLQDVEGGPLVSVLVPTRPGEGLCSDDLLRISALLAQVERRLRQELGGARAAAMADRCRGVVIDVIDEPTGNGLAVYVGRGVAEAYRLRHAPVDRVVIDPTFATRELEFAAHHHGRFRILAVGSCGVRYLSADDDSVEEVQTGVFPMVTVSERSGSEMAQWYRSIAEGLTSDSAHAELPVVFAGPRSVCDWVAELAGILPVGVVDVDGSTVDERSLHLIGRSLMESRVARERDHAFDLLDDAVLTGRAAIGLDDVWLAVKGGVADTVLVDPTVARGAWVDPSTHDIRWVDDPTVPGVIDDLVDEMIELTVLSGGSVVFSEPGGLGDDGVAAIIADAPVPVRLGRLGAVT